MQIVKCRKNRKVFLQVAKGSLQFVIRTALLKLKKVRISWCQKQVFPSFSPTLFWRRETQQIAMKGHLQKLHCTLCNIFIAIRSRPYSVDSIFLIKVPTFLSTLCPARGYSGWYSNWTALTCHRQSLRRREIASRHLLWARRGTHLFGWWYRLYPFRFLLSSWY